MSAKGFIYLIQEDFSYKYKIGKTKKLDDRLNLFEVKLPFNIKLISVIYSMNYSKTELLLHKFYKDKRVKGEWFDLTSKDIIDFKLGHFPKNILTSIELKQDLKLIYISKKALNFNTNYIKISRWINVSPTQAKIKSNRAFSIEQSAEEKTKKNFETKLKKILTKKEMEDDLLFNFRKIVLETGETRITELQKRLNVRNEKARSLMGLLINDGWVKQHKSRARGYELILNKDQKEKELNSLYGK